MLDVDRGRSFLVGVDSHLRESTLGEDAKEKQTRQSL